MIRQVYFTVAKWGKIQHEEGNEIINGKERKVTYEFGKYINQGWKLSPAQSKWPMEILNKAYAAGFDPDDYE